MNPPAHVDVGPHRYTVVVDEHEAQRERVTFGSTDTVYTRIVINPAQAPSQLRDTLTHEVIHALLNNAGLTDFDQAVLDHEAAERVCRALAPALLLLLRVNPDLAAYLTAE